MSLKQQRSFVPLKLSTVEMKSIYKELVLQFHKEQQGIGTKVVAIKTNSR